MDALTPASAVIGSPEGSPAAVHAAPASAGPSASAAPPIPPVHALPALPAAIQRAQLDPPPAKLMTREEMLSFLQLAV